MSAFTEDDKQRIQGLYYRWNVSIKRLAEMYNVSEETICSILRGGNDENLHMGRDPSNG